MATSRSQLVKELGPGLNALFGMEYERYEQEHTEIFDQESSDRGSQCVLVHIFHTPSRTERSNLALTL